MSKKEERYIVVGLILAALGCVAAWLAVPQVQSLLDSRIPSATTQIATLIETPTPTFFAMTTHVNITQTVIINQLQETPTKSPPTSTPVKPSARLGTLSIRVPENCFIKYSLTVGGNELSQGSVPGVLQIIEGTYDLVLRGDFGKQQIRSNLVLRADEETVVDVSKEFGVFKLISYAQIQRELSYAFYQGTTYYSNDPLSDTFAGKPLCGTPGEYNVSFNAYRSGYTLGSYWSVPHMILSDPISFKVEVRSGETTVAGPNTWPKQLGLVSFVSKKYIYDYFNMRAYELEDGKQTEVQVGYQTRFRSNEGYWILPGKYKIILADPYVGLSYNFDIKAGEETVLELPSSP